MMVTLHAYILRELLKSFGLTVLALTALFTMGGGLYNLLQFEGITAGDLVSVVPMMIPIVITLTMPVAALFAATLTYGRLAADNEFVACRAAGINVHRMFVSAMLLALFVALFSTVSINIVIPRFMQQIEYYARGNIRDLVYHRLRAKGHIRSGKAGDPQYVLTAQRVSDVSRAELVERGFDPPGSRTSYIWIDHPTFLLIDASGELSQFSVADGGLCQFDNAGREVNVTLYVKNARDYRIGKRVTQIGEQKIGPYPAPIRFPLKASMVDLATLYHWRDTPWESPNLLEKIDPYLENVRSYILYTALAERLRDGRSLTLEDSNGTQYTIQAASLAADDRELALADVVVRRKHPQLDEPTRYIAPVGSFRAEWRSTDLISDQREMRVVLTLRADRDAPVREFNPRAANPLEPTDSDEVRWEGIQAPPETAAAAQQITARAAVDRDVALPGDELFATTRGKLWQATGKLQRQVVGLIHFRLGFASSALVTIIMGAALGVMFRGSRALAAFGLACIPFGVITVLMLMGRQLTEHESTHTIGPLIIWGGLAAIALADVIILRQGVRR